MTIKFKKILNNVINSKYKDLIVIVFFLLFTLIIFSPVITNNKILSPGDGITYNLPMFQQGLQIWNKNIFLGYPAYADPQVASFFPLKLISQILSIDFNIYIVFAYLIGSVGTYYFIKTLLNSRYPALMAGLLVGFNLPLMQHLGHINLIYSFVFLPWILFSLLKILKESNKKYYLLLAFSVSFCILAGHIQTSFYVMLFSFLYTLISIKIFGFNLKKVILVIAIMVIGVGVSCIQLIPSINLYSQTPRASLSFDDFNSYTFSSKSIVSLVFPYIFGAVEISPGKTIPLSETSYFGAWNFTELAGFIGAFTVFMLIFTLLSSKTKEDNRHIKFLSILGLFLLVFMLSDISLIREIFYRVPLINLFRAHGRLILFVQFIFTIITSYGLMYLFDDIRSKRFAILKNKVLKTILLSSIFYFISYSIIYLFKGDLISKALSKGIKLDSVSPFNNISVALPLIFFVITIVSFLIIQHFRKSWLSYILISILILIEIVPIALNSEWNYYSPDKKSDYCNSDRFSKDVLSQKRRILIWDGVFNHSLPPNINMLCGILSLNGYNPLVLKKFTKYTGSNSIAMFEDTSKILASNKYLLNQLGVEEVVINTVDLEVINLLKDKGLKIKSEDTKVTIFNNLSSKDLIYSPKHVSYSLLDFLTILSSEVLDNDTVYVNKDPNLKDNNLKINTIENSISDKINISVDPINQNGYIFTSIVNYPGWRLRFEDNNGKVINNNGEIIEANGGFISFIVPANTKLIKLYFEPFDLKLGLAISLISFLVLILVTFVNLSKYSYKLIGVIKRNFVKNQ